MNNIETGLVIIWISAVIASAYGYISNIVNIVHMQDIFNSSIGIVSFVGIFVPPVGVILGYVY